MRWSQLHRSVICQDCEGIFDGDYLSDACHIRSSTQPTTTTSGRRNPASTINKITNNPASRKDQSDMWVLMTEQKPRDCVTWSGGWTVVTKRGVAELSDHQDNRFIFQRAKTFRSLLGELPLSCLVHGSRPPSHKGILFQCSLVCLNIITKLW